MSNPLALGARRLGLCTTYAPVGFSSTPRGISSSQKLEMDPPICRATSTRESALAKRQWHPALPACAASATSKEALGVSGQRESWSPANRGLACHRGRCENSLITVRSDQATIRKAGTTNWFLTRLLPACDTACAKRLGLEVEGIETALNEPWIDRPHSLYKQSKVAVRLTVV